MSISKKDEIKHLPLEGVVESYLKNFPNEKTEWISSNKKTESMMALTILKKYFKDTPISVYYNTELTPITESNLDCDYDYLFDIMDEKGRLVLPFSKKQPFFIYLHYYKYLLLEYFPELKEAKYAKVGYLDNNTRGYLVKCGFSQTFENERIQFRYVAGLIGRITIPERSNELKFMDDIIKLMEIKSKTEERLDKIEQELEELWKPDGVLCRAGKVCFENQTDYEHLLSDT